MQNEVPPMFMGTVSLRQLTETFQTDEKVASRKYFTQFISFTLGQHGLACNKGDLEAFGVGSRRLANTRIDECHMYPLVV